MKNRRFRNFILRPCLIGKDLLSIEKFGLVQYVSLTGEIPITLHNHQHTNITLLSDDFEDRLFIFSLFTGAFWCLWRWAV